MEHALEDCDDSDISEILSDMACPGGRQGYEEKTVFENFRALPQLLSIYST